MIGLSAEREGNALVASAVLDLAATGRDSVGPVDGRASRVVAPDGEAVALEGVAEDVAEVIPDRLAVEVVGVDGLGAAVVETVRVTGHLQGPTAGDGVLVEALGVGSAVRVQGVRARDGAADGPEGDGEITLVDDPGLRDSVVGIGVRHGDTGEGEDGGNGELHGEN